MNFKLSKEDVDLITKMDEGYRICDGNEWFNNNIFA